MITSKRIYDPSADDDGYRILIDRLWPRGISKEKANIDLWLKEIAPSTELRKWFDHDPQKWDEFQLKYSDELASREELLKQIKDLEKEHQKVTLLFAAKDTAHANIGVLLNLLKKK